MMCMCSKPLHGAGYLATAHFHTRPEVFCRLYPWQLCRTSLATTHGFQLARVCAVLQYTRKGLLQLRMHQLPVQYFDRNSVSSTCISTTFEPVIGFALPLVIITPNKETHARPWATKIRPLVCWHTAMLNRRRQPCGTGRDKNRQLETDYKGSVTFKHTVWCFAKHVDQPVEITIHCSVVTFEHGKP